MCLLALSFFTHAQTEMRTNVSTFEVIPLSNGRYNGDDLKGGFWNAHFYYRNAYDSAWKSWSGIAVSNTTDTVTNSYTNEFSSITGSGINGTKTYAVCYLGGTIIPEKRMDLTGFYVTNTTYTYRTIKDGSAFSKKFGGTSGNDKDWYRIKVTNYSAGVKTDSIRFYLADFQNDDNSKDYILNSWKWVDLSSFKSTDSLVIDFESSDVGSFGINTPTYLALDDFNAQSPNNYRYVFKPFNFNKSDFFRNGPVWNGQSDTSGGFLLDGLYFENYYNTNWDAWSGWAVSKSIDTSKTGFESQYTAIPGKSIVANDSAYAVSYGRSVIRMPYAEKGWKVWLKMSYTNSTYPYKSMKYGDAFSKKFGGILGTDPDYFKLYIIGYDANNKAVDTIGNQDDEMLLADFRKDPKYIQNKWTQIESAFNTPIVRMEFQLVSTDNGTFGMNTPDYFCLGNFMFYAESVTKLNSRKVNVYPNPSSNLLTLDVQKLDAYEIVELTGKQIEVNNAPQSKIIDISALSNGVYFLRIKADGEVYSSRFIKN